MTQSEFFQYFLHQKTKSPWALMQCWLGDDKFSHLPNLDFMTDGLNEWATAYIALAWHHAVKMLYY